MAKQIIRITAHYLEYFEICPLLFHTVVNLQRGSQGKLASLARGTAIHFLLAEYYKRVKDGRPFDESVTEAIDLFEPAAIDMNGLVADDVNLCVRVFHEYTQHYRDKDNFTVLTVEEKLSQVIYEDDDLQIIYEGTQDMNVRRIDGDVIPYDHKSESAKYPVSQLNNQFMGYCVLTGSTRMVRNAIGTQTSKKPEDKFYRLMYSYPTEKLNWWRRMTVKKVKQIVEHYKNDDWNSSANLYACDTAYRRGCDYRDVHSEEESEWDRILNTDYVEVPLYA